MASLTYYSTAIKHQPSPSLFKTPISTTSIHFTHSSPIEFPKSPFRISSELAPKARLIARRKETVPVQQLQRPLLEYMSLPASQYSVLDAERIERVDNNTFRCFVYRFKFFSFEVCPVLLVRVEEQRDGCCIKLLSCKLEGSPIVVAQNDKFEASMVNRISCDSKQSNSSGIQELTSDAVIEVSIDVPFPFRAIPVQMIESSGARVLDQILMIMLPRFMAQVIGGLAKFIALHH
ncbi:Protein PDC2 [Bienertia sinuspersici]